MHLEGREEIRAPRERVWAVVVDPHQVAQCVPGSPDIEVVDDRHFRIGVPIGAGFFKTRVVVDIMLTTLDRPEHAEAEATGSAMGGAAAATATLELAEAAAGVTAATWSAEVTLSGMLSGFAGMVEAPARDGIARTVACLKSRIESEAGQAG